MAYSRGTLRDRSFFSGEHEGFNSELQFNVTSQQVYTEYMYGSTLAKQLTPVYIYQSFVRDQNNHIQIVTSRWSSGFREQRPQ